MNIWSLVTWNVARAGGFTAFALLTGSVALGLALSLRWQSQRWPRFITSELHTFLTLLALIFTGVHILAVWIDPFTSFGWQEIFIPFASHYRPLWTALGIVACYLGIAIGITTWLRPRIGYTWWRRLHLLTILLYALVVVHAIATGSDTHAWWGAAMYALSLALVGTLLVMRLLKPALASSRSRLALAGAVVGLFLIGTLYALLGPVQAQWNAVLSNGKNGAQASPILASAAPHVAFTADLHGQFTKQGPDSKGIVTLRLTLLMSNGSVGQVQVVLQGQSGGKAGENLTITSSQIILVLNNGQPLYTGSLTSIYGASHWQMTASLQETGKNSKSLLQVQIDVQVDTHGQATGTITADSVYPAQG